MTITLLDSPCWRLFHITDQDAMERHYPTKGEADNAWLKLFDDWAYDQLSSVDHGDVDLDDCCPWQVEQAAERCLLAASCGRCGAPCDEGDGDGEEAHFAVGLLMSCCTGWSLVGAEVWCPRCVAWRRGAAGTEVPR